MFQNGNRINGFPCLKVPVGISHKPGFCSYSPAYVQSQSNVPQPNFHDGYSDRDSRLFYRCAEPVFFSLSSTSDDDGVWDRHNEEQENDKNEACDVKNACCENKMHFQAW